MILRRGISFTALVAAAVFVGIGVGYAPAHAAPALVSRVNEAFRSAYGRNPTVAENTYWTGRIIRKEKTTFEALRGAMFYHKAQGQTVGIAPAASKAVPGGGSSSKQEMIVQTLPLFVQIYGSNPSNAEKAWWRKRISCGEIKSMTDLANSMRFHHQHKARKGKDTICGQKGASASTASSGVSVRRIAGLSDHPMGDLVRIGIYHTNGNAIRVSASGQFQVREGNDVLATLGKDDEVAVSWSGGLYHVRGSGISHDVPGVIRLVPLSGSIMKIASYSDPSPTIPGKNYNRYRGIIEIRKCNGCNELWAINELHTEYYLRGLAETSGTGPAEYIKALGIAARTYVLYHKVVTGGRKQAQGFHIGRTADDQLYRGYEYELITSRMSSIFNSTKGMIATDSAGEEPVSTVYFSDSDGRTRSAKEVWNTSRFPHLQQSVDDPHHASSSCRGHCVGMSAQGAYGFASKDGWNFSKILNYYYKGIKLVRAY